jgi:hypothetical protein
MPSLGKARIEATKEKVEITGIIPVEITATRSSDSILTTEQTLGSLLNCRYTYIEGRGYALSRA